MRRLFVTGQDVTPMEISNGLVTIREDMSISQDGGRNGLTQEAFTAGRRPKEGVSIITNYTCVFVLLVLMLMVSTDERDVVDIGMTALNM